jgi:hypothetical protein
MKSGFKISIEANMSAPLSTDNTETQQIHSNTPVLIAYRKQALSPIFLNPIEFLSSIRI